TGVAPIQPSAPANVTPTPFPASLVAIQQPGPGSEPDPIGLKAALDVLKTPGLFDDHSGIDDLKSLRTSLADASAKAEGVKDSSSGSATPATAPSKGSAPAAGSDSGGAAPSSGKGGGGIPASDTGAAGTTGSKTNSPAPLAANAVAAPAPVSGG